MEILPLFYYAGGFLLLLALFQWVRWNDSRKKANQTQGFYNEVKADLQEMKACDAEPAS
ncbi:MAG: hypothetical protein HYT79_08815 [Elusimicrobia bacterium]|nr:hypothetical protein [Elusimicrobiota bacterium]